MIKCRRRQATDPQKFKKIVNGRFFVFCWWKRKRLKNNRFHIPAYKLDFEETMQVRIYALIQASSFWYGQDLSFLEKLLISPFC